MTLKSPSLQRTVGNYVKQRVSTNQISAQILSTNERRDMKASERSREVLKITSGTESRVGAPHTPLPEKIYQYSVIVKNILTLLRGRQKLIACIGTESVSGQNRASVAVTIVFTHKCASRI